MDASWTMREARLLVELVPRLNEAEQCFSAVVEYIRAFEDLYDFGLFLV
jgi:hypothetical protein